DPNVVGAAYVALRKPVHPRALDFLHAEDLLRPVSAGLMTRSAIERRVLEIALVVNAVRRPIVLDAFGEKIGETAARLVVAGLLEADEVEIELTGRRVAAHDFGELLS